MLTKEQYTAFCERSVDMLNKAGIIITGEERASMQVAEYGLGMPDSIGLQLVVYINTDRCCAKELILFPRQTCPEHRHPPIGEYLGKEETFRCRYGTVYLYVPGEPTSLRSAVVPRERADCFTVWHEIVLNPGDQYTLQPDTLHWFQAGSAGAVVSEFSTKSQDEFDVYTDSTINPALERRA